MENELVNPRIKGAVAATIVSVVLWCLIGIGVVLLASGCAGKNATFAEKQQNMVAAMDALRQANFKGQIRFNEGGSILGLNASTNWSLGPQQVTLAVEGEVDFTKPARTPESVTP